MQVQTIDLNSNDAFPSLPSLGSGVKKGSMLSKPMAAPLGVFKAAATPIGGGLTGLSRGKTTERFEILEMHLVRLSIYVQIVKRLFPWTLSL
jgi:hypothetical protein